MKRQSCRLRSTYQQTTPLSRQFASLRKIFTMLKLFQGKVPDVPVLSGILAVAGSEVTFNQFFNKMDLISFLDLMRHSVNCFEQ